MKRKTVKFLVVVVLAVAFILPNFSSAATVEELQAQIAALLKQLQLLQQQLNQQKGGWCHDFNTNLRIGDGAGIDAGKSDEVNNLQIVLEKEGFSVDSSEKKGGSSFEEYTAAAVSGFQEKYRDEILTPAGLKAGTGFVGKATRAKLNSLYGCGVVPPPTASSIKVSPFRGGDFVQGVNNWIDWSGGKNKVKIGLVNVSYAAANSHGLIDVMGWVTLYGQPNNSAIWDGLKVMDLNGGVFWPVTPGKYKILLVSEDSQGNYCFSAGCNFDLSPSFNIDAASIKVISPNGGEKLEIGKTYSIQWNSNNAANPNIPFGKTVVIDLTREKEKIYGIGTAGLVDGVIMNLQWTIPSSITPGDYLIRISSVGNDGQSPDFRVYDFSDAPFSIVAATSTTSSIKVISPNGGEQLIAGQGYYITWAGIGSPEKVRILLYKGNDYASFKDTTGSVYYIGGVAALDVTTGFDVGRYYWTVPTSLPSAGDYRIGVQLLLDSVGGYIMDQSNAPFSIVAATSTSSLQLNVSLDPSSPMGNIIAGAAYVSMAKFKLSASINNDIVLSSVTIGIISNTGKCSLQNVRLLDNTGIQLGSTVVTLTSCDIGFSSFNLIIPKGASKSLSVMADIPASSFGQTLALQLTNVASPSSGLYVTGLPVTANTMTITSRSASLFRVTANTYLSNSDLNAAVQKEFGTNFHMADWNDVKANISNDSMAAGNWADALGIADGGQVIVTNGGQRVWGIVYGTYPECATDKNRYYFIQRDNALGKPGYFLAHDQIGDYYLLLGSWCGLQMKILAISTGMGSVTNQSFSQTANVLESIGSILEKLKEVIGQALQR